MSAMVLSEELMLINLSVIFQYLLLERPRHSLLWRLLTGGGVTHVACTIIPVAWWRGNTRQRSILF